MIKQYSLPVRSGYIQNEAIACELAAKFYAAEGRIRVARTYMSDAFSLYRKWGAIAKAQDLKWQYPDLLDEVDCEEIKGEIMIQSEVIKNIFQYYNIRESKASNSLDIHSYPKGIKRIFLNNLNRINCWKLF
jgi:hypothetical protein